MEAMKQLDRREFLKLGGAAVVGLMIPDWAYAKADAMMEKSLSFYNIHTGEQIKTTFWADGIYIPESLEEINRVLRDHRTGDVAQMDVQVLELLHTLQTKLESNKAFHVISGYRSEKTNAMLNKTTGGVAKKSMHMLGKAIDVNLPGTQLAMLRKAAMSAKAGGVGYYPSSNFVHVDTGRVRYW